MLFESKDNYNIMNNITVDYHQRRKYSIIILSLAFPLDLSSSPYEIECMLMQTFNNYWFSEDKMPTINDFEALLQTINYFIERISSIENTTYSDIIRTNSLYTNFSQNIFDLLFLGKIDQDDCMKLQQYLNDDIFSRCFIRVFFNVVQSDYETNFNKAILALNKVGILLLFIPHYRY